MKRSINKKRKSIKVTIVSVLMLTMLLIVFTSQVVAINHLNTKEIIIASGDSLWSIAREVKDEHKNINIQKVIYDIEKINNLTNSNIYVGQLLEVPVY